ncbi:hypothetical protein B0E50_14660 [Rhodanobacter sp. C01]|nr:hypothetical protein B0E50_14660 [Rhodanobacter sp. C01]
MSTQDDVGLRVWTVRHEWSWRKALEPGIAASVLFMEDARQVALWWMPEYNEQRAHDSLGHLTPNEYSQHVASSSTVEVPA